MRDTEVVASVVAGDPDGLAAAYDRYADPLYKYCRSMLRDPADAADAVQDTFVIAASRLAQLREPDRLRAWLYTVARNECLRILRSAKGTSALDGAPEVTDATAGAEASAGQAELRALLENAIGGLNSGEREVIELRLRQGLEPAEVATVLGVSRNHAHSLLSRAHDQLAACLGVLLVGRAGRADCGELGSLLADWDGRLTAALRKRVHRHIEGCATCASRSAAELRPDMLLDLSPGAAMTAAAAESLRLAVGAPAGLKAHTLALATGPGPAAAAHRAAVLSRAGTFTGQGFPPVIQPGARKAGAASGRHGRAGRARSVLRGPRRQAATAAAVLLAVIVVVAAFALTGNTEHAAPAAATKLSAAARSPLAAPAATPGSVPPGSESGSPSALATPPTTAVTSATPAAPATTASATPSAVPTTAKPSRQPSPAPTPTTPSPTPPPATPTPSPPGSLALFPVGGTQAHPAPFLVVPGSRGASIHLMASGTGGNWAVNWAVTIAGDPGAVISVSPAASGSLTPARPNAKVTITASQSIACGRRGQPACPTITISPGGAVFTILTGWSRSFTGSRILTPRPAPMPGNVSANSPFPISHRRLITLRS